MCTAPYFFSLAVDSAYAMMLWVMQEMDNRY